MLSSTVAALLCTVHAQLGTSVFLSHIQSFVTGVLAFGCVAVKE